MRHALWSLCSCFMHIAWLYYCDYSSLLPRDTWRWRDIKIEIEEITEKEKRRKIQMWIIACKDSSSKLNYSQLKPTSNGKSTHFCSSEEKEMIFAKRWNWCMRRWDTPEIYWISACLWHGSICRTKIGDDAQAHDSIVSILSLRHIRFSEFNELIE